MYNCDILTGNPGLHKVLGLYWGSAPDHLRVDAHVNISEKMKGVCLQPNVEAAYFCQLVVTHRVVWHISLGQYDPLGGGSHRD